MKFILMGLLRQFRKNYGREPSFDELRTLGNQAKEIEQLDRGQVIPFPETRITDPFTPRPEPKMKPRKPETEAEMKARMERQNKEAVERLKKKKEQMKDDPEKMAIGGLAGSLMKLLKKAKNKKSGDKIYGVGGEEIDVADLKKKLGLDKDTEKKDLDDLEKKLQMIIGKDRTKHEGGGLAGFAGDQFTQDTRDTFTMSDRFGTQLFTNPMPQMIPGGIMQTMPQMMQPMQTGIMSLEEGGPVDPSKRKFIKILGGLASIPVLGKFIKPAVKVAQNPEVARRFSGVPAYFTKLVEKIKMFGDDAPGLTSVEREVGKKYKDYELVEDLSSGEIVVKRNKQGVSMMGDDMVEGTMQEEVMAFRPRKTTEDGIIPEEYEEVTVKPDMEGKMKEVEDGLDSLDDILLEVGERSNKAGGGLAYMLGE